MAYSARHSVPRKLPVLMTATLALLAVRQLQDLKPLPVSGLTKWLPVQSVPGARVDEEKLAVEVIP
jgi:hypothetical protein